MQMDELLKFYDNSRVVISKIESCKWRYGDKLMVVKDGNLSLEVEPVGEVKTVTIYWGDTVVNRQGFYQIDATVLANHLNSVALDKFVFMARTTYLGDV